MHSIRFALEATLELHDEFLDDEIEEDDFNRFTVQWKVKISPTYSKCCDKRNRNIFCWPRLMNTMKQDAAILE